MKSLKFECHLTNRLLNNIYSQTEIPMLTEKLLQSKSNLI